MTLENAQGWCVVNTTRGEIAVFEDELAWSTEGMAQTVQTCLAEDNPAEDFRVFQCTVGFVS